MRFPTMWLLPAYQIRLRIKAFASRLNYVITVKLLTEHHLEFLSFKDGCISSSESTLVKIPHCRRSIIEKDTILIAVVGFFA